MSYSNRPAHPRSVAEYLVAAYEVDESTAKRLVEENDDVVLSAAEMGSFAYFPGDKIASKAGLAEREGFEDDDESED